MTPAAAPGGRSLVALIPAYNPDAQLAGVVRDLHAAGLASIIVIDDGSGPGSAPAFATLEGMPGVLLLRHPRNRGKGRAIKTGLACFLERYPEAAGVVTVDADGQHRGADVARVAADFLAAPDALVIGARRFEGRVPLRSRVGNALARRLFRCAGGPGLTDTQTGLRCFPRAAVPRLLAVAGERYEYELAVLAACRSIPLAIREVSIATVYLDGNRGSHFSPLRDSLRIFLLLLRLARSRRRRGARASPTTISPGG